MIEILQRFDEHPEAWFWENSERVTNIPDGMYILIVNKDKGTLAVGLRNQFLLSRVHNVSVEHGLKWLQT